jgi:hypothetical protein
MINLTKLLILIIIILIYKIYCMDKRLNHMENNKTVEGMANVGGINTEALASLSSMYDDGKLIVKNLQVTDHADINNMTFSYGRTLNGLWFGPNSGNQRSIGPGGGRSISFNNADLDISKGDIQTKTQRVHDKLYIGNNGGQNLSGTPGWINVNSNLHAYGSVHNDKYQLIGRGEQFTLHNGLWNMPMGVCGTWNACGGKYYKPVLGPVNGKGNAFTKWSIQ